MIPERIKKTLSVATHRALQYSTVQARTSHAELAGFDTHEQPSTHWFHLASLLTAILYSEYFQSLTQQ